MFGEHRLELMEEACATAEGTVETFQEEMGNLRKLAGEIEATRHEGLAPLRWVESLTDSNLSYDPSFPIEGGFQFPKTAEEKPLAIAELLRRFYLDGESANE